VAWRVNLKIKYVDTTQNHFSGELLIESCPSFSKSGGSHRPAFNFDLIARATGGGKAAYDRHLLWHTRYNASTLAMLLRSRLSRAIDRFNARNTPMQFDLFGLPEEIVLLIVEYVEDAADLQHLASTCRRLQELAEEKLWQALLIRRGRTARHIARCFHARPQRIKAVRTIQLPCKQGVVHDFTAVNNILRATVGVRELYFESPECNTTDEDTFENADDWKLLSDHVFTPFQEALAGYPLDGVHAAPLQKLRKCRGCADTAIPTIRAEITS